MTTEELDEWADDFEAFHALFAGLFARSEPREQAAKYMRGLMASVGRKNGWQIAEAVGIRKPSLLYHFKSKDELRENVISEMLAHWNAVLPGLFLKASIPCIRGP